MILPPCHTEETLASRLASGAPRNLHPASSPIAHHPRPLQIYSRHQDVSGGCFYWVVWYGHSLSTMSRC